MLSEDGDRRDYVVYELGQLYGGVPVQDGVFTVAADKDGVLSLVRGGYVAIGGLDVEPRVSAGEAASALSLSAGQRVAEAMLMIAVDDQARSVLAWRIEVSGASALDDCLAYVDAKTGMLIREESTAQT